MLYNQAMSEAKRKEKKRWFKAREFGWGWRPVTWQGWAITILYTLAFTLTILTFIVWIVAALEADSGFRNVILGLFEFVAWMAFLTYTLMQICYLTGEKPGWRWGLWPRKVKK